MSSYPIVNRHHFFTFCDAIVLQTQTRCQTGVNFHSMKLSQMAADPLKPQKFNPAKVKANTVRLIHYIIVSC